MDHSQHDHHSHGAAEDTACVFHHAMVFHGGVCQEILFPGWRTTTGLQVFGSAVALFMAGLLYEGLKYYRERLHLSSRRVPKESQVDISKNEFGRNGGCQTTSTVKYSMWSQEHIIQTILHVFQATISYVLMLVFMTYNVWLCLGLVLGLGAGFFIFGWRKNVVVDATEHCH